MRRLSCKAAVAAAVIVAGAFATTAYAAVMVATASPKPNSVSFVGAKPGSGKGLKLGYISLGESVPFVRLVSNGIKQQAKIAGAQLVFCDSALDAAKALDCAKTFKTQGVQGYLNFDVFQNASAGICKAGPQVPVIAIDIHQKPCEKAFMGANNLYAGYISGRAVGQYFKSHFKCQYDTFVSLESSAAGIVNTQRLGGYRQGFTSVCGKIHNFKKIDGADRIDPARTKFADALTALPGQHHIIVVSINDDGIEGALSAAETAGRVNDLYVSGQGADPSAWCLIKNNKQWIADSAYFPEKYGLIGIPYLIKLVKGQAIPKELYVPHVIITGANITKYYKPTNC
jgi:ribose transport system substrate-binding protein